jgi:catechol-2,3-dioxygenase
MIGGINHVTLSVTDLESSFEFYKNVLGFRPLAKRRNKSAYFLSGSSWVALVVDPSKSSEVPKHYAHIAFSVERSGFREVASRIIDSGAKIWQENSSPGESLYFLDPSGNKLEIHAGDWRSRLKWLRENPSPEVEVYDPPIESLQWLSASYSPQHYLSAENDIAFEIIRCNELATVISSESQTQISHIPLMPLGSSEQFVLLGHMSYGESESSLADF